MTRRCSHCSNNGHNSRTCPTRAGPSGAGAGAGGGVRIFGVQLRKEGVGIMKKSASMSCLAAAAAAGGGGPSSGDLHGDHGRASGYASDDPAHASCSSNSRNDRKKGTPWTEEEHRKFLLGLQELGKGDWRGISQKYVVSRTPTQVASHAQKYFIRQSNTSRRKRRSSLFDMVAEMPADQVPAHEEQFLPQSSSTELGNASQLPNLNLGQQETGAAESSTPDFASKLGESRPYNSIPIAMVPTFYPAFIPVPLPYWTPNFASTMNDNTAGETHEILRPTPVVAKEPGNSDEVVGMSKLSIKEGSALCMQPSSLSIKLMESSSARKSAFHTNPSIPGAGPDLNQSSSSPIHAV